MENSEEIERYKRAQEQVKNLKGFYIHLVIFVLVMAMIIYINLKFTPEYYWFFYVLLGGGIGLLFHALGTFNKNNVFSKEWENRKIQEFIEEEERENKES